MIIGRLFVISNYIYQMIEIPIQPYMHSFHTVLFRFQFTTMQPNDVHQMHKETSYDNSSKNINEHKQWHTDNSPLQHVLTEGINLESVYDTVES